MDEYLRISNGGLEWGPLIEGRLVRRYQRFLAEVRLDNDRTIIAHCPNTGSMRSCSEPGRTVYLSPHDNPQRRLKYTWELISEPTSLVGVNTAVPNRLVKTGISAGNIEELLGYDQVQSEVKTNDGVRLDLRLTGPRRRPCYIEIKNCTLVEDGWAMFPDAVTKRGAKHLEELVRLARTGVRAVVFFLIQRMDARWFQPADRIDPVYGRALRLAVSAGVEALAYDVNIDLRGLRLNRSVPIIIDD